MKTVSTSYVLWLGCLLQIHGLHRLYNGKVFTGLLWMCSFGLLGVGQLIDLILIPRMVENYNTQYRLQRGLPVNAFPNQTEIHRVIPNPAIRTEPVPLTQDQLMIKLLKAAEARGGKLSVTQGVIDTEVGFVEVEAVLKKMVKTGYVAIDNDPVTGVVVYDFKEL